MPDELFPDDLDFGQTIHIPRFGTGQKIFRRYILKKILGRGGMGVVWLAEDLDLERFVALKVLPETLCHDRESLMALKHETKLGLHLAHPNIVRIYDFQRDDNAVAISMEYVDGATFSEVRATKPTHVFDPHDLHPYIEALCDALHYAHNRERIVHRDLKPRNLMMNSRGDLKIADFGISRTISDSMIVLTGTRGSTGSPPYISPQQWDGEPPTPLDDIYSVGATLYELLSSRPPFLGIVDWQQVHHKIPPSISKRRVDLGIQSAAPVPAEWEETIAACLAKDPKDRPQTIRDLQARLTINGQMPVATAQTKTAPVIRSRPEVTKTADLSEEDSLDDVTVKDFTNDILDTATIRVDPKLEAPTGPVEVSSPPAAEPILNKLGDVIEDDLTPPSQVSAARSEQIPDAPTAPVEISTAPATEAILNKLGDDIKDELTPPLHVSVDRAQQILEAPSAPVAISSAPASEPIGTDPGEAVQDEIAQQLVSTARAEPALDTPTAPVEDSSVSVSEPTLNKPDVAIQDQVTGQDLAEGISAPSEPTAGASAPATSSIANPAPPLELPVGPTHSLDVLPQARAVPTNGDVEFPGTTIQSLDRRQVIRPRPRKVPRWVWVTAATLMVGTILTWWVARHLPPVPKKKPAPPESTAPSFADLLIESEPSGADLTLDGRTPITTPYTFKDLKFGHHRLKITLDGYLPIERDIEFSGARLPKIVLEPRPKPVEQVAKLSVRSDPPGASIRLDGTLPQKPNTFENVKFGKHRLSATMEGFQPKEQAVVVSKDTSSEMVLKLERVKDPLQSLLDEFEKAEAASDWKKYREVSLQLLGRLTSKGEPTPNEHRKWLTSVIEGLRTKKAPLTSEEFRAYEENLKYAARLDILPAILIVADKLRTTNSPEAFNWYYYAADKKHNAYAMTKVAWLYWLGQCGQQVDKPQAFEWFKRAFEAGDTDAGMIVGTGYVRGDGTPKDEDEGIRILLPLAKLGVPHAKTLIGQCYYNGSGQFGKLSQSERDRMAKTFFEEAILAGDWAACGHLGVIYEAGRGVPKDWKQAARLYLQGVEHDDPICMYYYARALENHGAELAKMFNRQDKPEPYYVKAAAASVAEARQWCIEHNVKF